MKELEKKYNFKESEQKWQKYWQEHKIFKFNWEENNKKANEKSEINNIFSIDTPPPHVSGVLHMGHIFGYTQMDTIARFNRMNGKNVFFPIGYDDNGLPSEKFVEKKINKKSKSMVRKEFVDICEKEISEVELIMKNLFISASFSFDFDEEYKTISKTSRKLSQMSFIDLYNKGHIYQKEEPVIWDIVDQTALAQIELEDIEIESQMNYLKFILIDKTTGEQNIIEVMTTRPELLPACVALFCHPDEKNKYTNKNAITPLGAVVPVLFDENVTKEKGTGIMMCCTFGDQADVEKWKKYNLDLKIILNEQGILDLNSLTIDTKYKEELNGLFVEKARKKILDLLSKEKNLTRKPITINHTVKVGERSKYPVEILVKKQWLIKTTGEEFKKAMHEQVKKCNWQPSYMETRMHNWIDGLNWDWCVSRQRFFGVPIPIWYSRKKGDGGKIILPNINDLPIDPLTDLPSDYTPDEIIPESDVLDTWATSAITPQLTSYCLNNDLFIDKKRKDILDLPFNLRFQGHDIIRTWAFCTLTKAYYHNNIIPWKNILINGFCLSENGKKMSKSIGNVIDPTKIIKEYSSDALRYWANNSSLGVDINFSIGMIKIGQKLITKLFNAGKFCELHFKNLINNNINLEEDLKNNFIFKKVDLWVLTKLSELITDYKQLFEKFEYNKALEIVENFFWNYFCDNYLEIVKIRCYGIEGIKYQNINLSEKEKLNIQKEQQSSIKTIYYLFNCLLKLFAPFLPIITEEVFSCLYNNEFNQIQSIHKQNSFETLNNFNLNNQSLINFGEEILKIIAEIRKYKSEKNISIKEILNTVDLYTNIDLMDTLDDLKNVCGIKDIFLIENEELKVIIK